MVVVVRGILEEENGREGRVKIIKQNKIVQR